MAELLKGSMAEWGTCNWLEYDNSVGYQYYQCRKKESGIQTRTRIGVTMKQRRFCFYGALKKTKPGYPRLCC